MGFLFSLKEVEKSVQVRKNKESIEVIAEMRLLLSLKVVKNPVKAEKQRKEGKRYGVDIYS